MKVKELIKHLKLVADKELEVYIFDDGILTTIEMVDELDDRVDLNMGERL